MTTLRRGDHIYISRWLGLYEHHGIYCGDGAVIHHTSGGGGPKGKVKRMSLEFRPFPRI